MQYRVYLLDLDARIRAAESFIAPNDLEASAIGGSVHQACCDEFAGYEVWRGSERITKEGTSPSARPIPRLEDIIHSRQEDVLDLEDRLQRTFLCLQRSRKLLEESAKLRRASRI